ncbi:MAG: PorP/SprF family type IX secretion system membrane protein [Chitinophagaceae bacterium]|nr:PorP/SprF family type IX secretion system membrane protein [Chitinophagaceae bacterium]
MQEKNIKTIVIFWFAAIICTTANAQQLFRISNYMDHNFILNPAAVGANGHASFGAAYRSQWSGIEGGPTTAVVFGDAYFPKMNTGLGIILYSDKTGPTSRTGGELDLSYSIKFDNDNNKRLMIGMGAQVIQFKVNLDEIADAIPNDPLLASSGTGIKADANAGIYYRSNTFNMGVAAKQLIQPKLNFVKTATNPEGRLYRQYLANAFYNIKTDESNIIQPHVEFRYQPEAPVDLEAGLTVYHKDMLHIGGSYRYKQFYTLYAGIKLMHKFSINYAYEAYNAPVGVFESGYSAHEIMLRYFFTKK